MITEKTIIEEQKLQQDISFRINYLYGKLDTTSQSEYKKAVEEFHKTETIWAYFIKNNGFIKIKNGDHDWISQAILYIEVDPYYFRSGYFKEKILESLKKAPLNNEERIRIQMMLIGIVKKCFRREMKYYCKLAKSVSDKDFIDKIGSLADYDSSQAVRVRAQYMLKYIKQENDKSEL